MKANIKYTTLEIRIHISLRYTSSQKRVPLVQPGYRKRVIKPVISPRREARMERSVFNIFTSFSPSSRVSPVVGAGLFANVVSQKTKNKRRRSPTKRKFCLFREKNQVRYDIIGKSQR